MVTVISRAAFWAAVLSGLPSTAWSIAHHRDPLEATRAAGLMVLPDDSRSLPLAGAAAAVHGALSLGWTCVIARTLPQDAGRARSVLHGALLGAAIAGLDLGVAHVVRTPRFAPIRELPVAPQLADHVAFGAVAGFVLRGS